MYRISIIWLISAIISSGDSGSIAIIKKCAIQDNECLRDFYRSLLQGAADSGYPDYNVSSIDPFKILNAEVNALGMIKISMPNGVAKGFKSCRSTNYRTNIEEKVTYVEMFCDVFTIEGEYIIQTTPILEALIGGIQIHGEGKCKATIEKLQMNLEIGYEFKKLDDGELYGFIVPDKTSYTFEVLGKATISADNLYVGTQDISTVAVNIFNENSKSIMKSFGKSFFDKAIEVFIENANKLLAKLPLKDFITDDVSSLA